MLLVIASLTSLNLAARQPEVILTPQGQVLIVYDQTTGQITAIIPVSKTKQTK
jgi:hypothetical protein